MKTISASELDEKFDNDEDISEYIDFSKAEQPNKKHKRVNVDFPVWMLNELDRMSKRLGVTRQSLIKLWLADKLQSAQSATKVA